ncbi:50S ribosomal protein L35 [bacterium]|nr:50S ribosomal protein L35 [bacterium]
MPKLKTRKAVAKRFSVTKSGKVKRSSAKTRHLLVTKNADKKRRLRRGNVATKTDALRAKKMMPYG